MSDMKAISPMLATILLIAFTVAVGGILSVWMSSFTRTTTGSVENTSTDVTKCAGTYIDVVNVANGTIIIANRGSQTITSISCFAGNGSYIGPSGSLSPGSSNSSVGWHANQSCWNCPYASGFGTVVSCSGKCLTVGVTGSCKRGESCWTAS